MLTVRLSVAVTRPGFRRQNKHSRNLSPYLSLPAPPSPPARRAPRQAIWTSTQRISEESCRPVTSTRVGNAHTLRATPAPRALHTETMLIPRRALNGFKREGEGFGYLLGLGVRLRVRLPLRRRFSVRVRLGCG